MYIPKYKSIQILIPILKLHNIAHIVISPGSRMREFILAVEEDPFFTCYSVVDERSASYFAIGISQELNVPVAITCTSSTATTNYYPGITEAYYQQVPILVLTGDRDPYLLGQQEDQMINQVNMYDRVVQKSVDLPIIKDENDSWYCSRLINEAILELDHKIKGPVHINIPVPALITWSNEQVDHYPEVKAIKRYSFSNQETEYIAKTQINKLKKANKILVLAGQNTEPFNSETLSDFFQKYNCIIHSEHMGNYNAEGRLNISMLAEGPTENDFEDFKPDIVISFHGTLGITRNLKELLRKKKTDHWHISENGEILDAYKNLTSVFETSPEIFFKYAIKNSDNKQKNNKIYYNLWRNKFNEIKLPKIPYSNVYAIRELINLMPKDSILHLSILNSVRISHFYNLPKNTKVYANIGTDGIDGCMSTFIGQAFVSNRLSFLIIGDLSFFYDMNAIRIKHIKNNVRIILINNYGGNEFYQQPIMPTTDLGLGAKHNNSAKGWTKSVGFDYLEANNEDECLESLKLITCESNEKPMLLEIFTNTMVDREIVKLMKESMSPLFNKNAAMKQKVKSVIGDSSVKKLKSILKR
ncbi:2-succinyl-5-enolpyruvyl-6-hydroxy-3-cyclohexene-1-carboxylic-acid synthase [Saccharicrinis aurantiacus]|uniref:2-succinyl-5-enolpyruvyl-6-hydroxy-3- cyclohexene-1-carboxylic-acid synthase n=1 Tax=Saccharicrinis aurantiacus TaxID=1849719 RepID=UPI0024902D31|nr:2-succinyl-5-enolpyruvyl-6-hydroxy-3-cyclohexene-1-carboxylic-acid synthase [Saccharicrinis aurantiacus]